MELGNSEELEEVPLGMFDETRAITVLGAVLGAFHTLSLVFHPVLLEKTTCPHPLPPMLTRRGLGGKEPCLSE